MLKVKLNTNFGTHQLPMRKKICEEFSFAEKRASAHEIIRMQVEEGACLSMLGTITITSSGEVQMDNLIQVVAGGISEVKTILNKQI